MFLDIEKKLDICSESCMMITSIEFYVCTLVSICKAEGKEKKIVTGCIVIPFSSFECESAEHLLCFVYYKL